MKSKNIEKINQLLDQINDLRKEDNQPNPDPFNGIDPTDLDPSKIYYVRMMVINNCLFKGSSLFHYGKEYMYNFRDNQLHNNDIPMAGSVREILEIRESNEKERQSMYDYYPELMPVDGTFTYWWVGQRVWNVITQKWEIIERIDYLFSYPIVTDKNSYLKNGRILKWHTTSTIYPRKVKIVAE